MAPAPPNVDAASLFGVPDLIAVITGGGSGIGAMMARALDANGAANVFVLGRRIDSLKAVAATAKNGRIIPVACDVTSKDSLQNAVDEVSKHVSHVDVLVANSGATGPKSARFSTTPGVHAPLSLSDLRDALWEVPMEDFNEPLNVNITGAFYSAIAFLPLLDAANKLRPVPSSYPRAQVIATSSVAGFGRGNGSGWAYGASKAGLMHLMKVMATAFCHSDFGIRVNVIAPGLYPSEMTEGLFKQIVKTDEGLEGSVSKDLVPAKRCGSEEDIAGVLLWLCSRAGAFVNGNVVVTDGGSLNVRPSVY